MSDFPEGAVLIFGASGGIGQGIAREFVKAGTNVALTYHSKKDVVEKAAAELEKLGAKTSIHKVDVRERAQVDRVVEEAIGAHGRIHTVVWGAGPVVPQVLIADWPDEMVRASFEIEVFGFYNAVRSVIPHMRAKGGGSFVHLGSAGDDWWPKLDGLSVGPKAANDALIRGIAKEEGEYEIRANTILVGVIDAGQFQVGKAAGTFDEKWEQETKKLLPLRRWGTAEDIGQAAVFFASKRGNYVTGQTIAVSGGFGV